MSKTSNRDNLLRLLDPLVTGLGVDLEDVQVQPAGRRRLLRVVVDQDGGVGLDTVAEVSTAVAAVLDESDAMRGQAYVLEVTSPGVDRPLTEPRHWRRARSRLVQAVLVDGEPRTGRVVDVGDDGVLLDVSGEEQVIPWPDLVSGRMQIEFSRKAGSD